MDVQIAEQPPESQMLVLRQMLVTKEDHQVFGQRPVQFVDLPVAERCARSTPSTSAPMIGVSLSTVIVRRARVICRIFDPGSSRRRHELDSVFLLVVAEARRKSVDML